MTITQLALTLGGQTVKTLFDLRANLISTKVSGSHRKSTQVHARPWPNGVASKPKVSTCVYLRLRLAKALGVLF